MTLPRTVFGWLACAISVAVMAFCVVLGWNYLVWIFYADRPPQWMIGTYRTYATVSGLAVIAAVSVHFFFSVNDGRSESSG